ncbi:MAG TPA: hypothetical protein VL084_07635 [Thermoanaerobaculia bacterium]|nr:hypothetical protein [Thermoanaerobaculia bacterium]
MSTQTISLAVSRLVPLMLMTTFVLVAARLVADRVASAERTNRLIFGGLLALGLLLQGPFALRSLALFETERAIERRDAGNAVRWMASYRRLGGTLGPWRTSRWMGFLVRGRLWATLREQALATLAAAPPPGVRHASDVRLSLGIAQYYLGETKAAEAALREAVDPAPSTLFLARYFEGRLAERRGEVRPALDAYSAALSKDPGFRPALYQLVRLLAAAAGPETAREALSQVLAAAPAAPEDPIVAALHRHLAAGTVPPEKEFEIVLP